MMRVGEGEAGVLAVLRSGHGRHFGSGEVWGPGFECLPGTDERRMSQFSYSVQDRFVLVPIGETNS